MKNIRGRLLVLGLIAITSGLVPARGQALIASNGFEGADNWNFTSTGSGVVTNLLNVANDNPTNARIRSGSYSWQSRVFGSPANSSNVVTFDSIALGASTARQVNVRLASISLAPSAANGAEATDLVRVFVALNGAAFSSTPDVSVGGNNNARWSFGATNVARTGAGTPLALTAPQGGTSSNNYATLSVNLPNSATSAALRVIAFNNDTNELWCIDDVELSYDSLNWSEPTSAAPPTFQSIGNKLATNNLPMSFAVVALDNIEQDQITLSASNLPAGAVFNTVTNLGGVTNNFSWTPNAPGIYTTTFYAVDNDGATSSNVLITVLDPPSIVITTPAQSVAYAQSSIAIGGSASTNALGQFSWTNSLNGDNGVILATTNWLVSSVSLGVGVNVFIIRATNQSGEFSTASVTITRDQPALPGCADLIHFQGFEPGDAWTISDGSANISTDAGAGDTPAGQRIATGANSWQVQGQSVTLSLAQVSISGYTGRYVQARIASLSTTTGNGADAADSMHLFVSVDGASYAGTPEVNLSGNSNARWGFWATNSYTALAGSATVIASPQGATSTNNYSTVNILIPDGATSVAVRVWAQNNTNSEVWAVDNVAVYGCLGGGNPNDTDGDLLPNDWESLYFGSSTAANPGDDDDGDGSPNIDEFVAQTIPVLPAGATSYFRNVSISVGTRAVGYPSATGRLYRLWGSQALIPGTDWAQVAGPQAGDGLSQTLQEGAGTTSSYYRITVEMTNP